MKQINVAIIGALGRMGNNNLKIINNRKNLKIVSAIDRTSHPSIGKKVSSIIPKWRGKEENLVFADKNDIIEKGVEVCVDFSTPECTCNFVKELKEKNYNGVYIIGTTGFSEEEYKILKEASKNFLIIASGNFSIGINVLLKLVAKTNQVLQNYDVEIIEHHHNQKIDSPSGTAKMLLDVCYDEKKEIVNGRKGIVGKRKKDEIGMSVVRGGGIIGKHEVLFIGDNDQLTLTHNAFNRDAFTNGILYCIDYFLKNTSKVGYLDMIDVLRL